MKGTGVENHLHVQHDEGRCYSQSFGQADEHPVGGLVAGNVIEINSMMAGLVDRLGFKSDLGESFEFGGIGGHAGNLHLAEGEVVTSIVVTWDVYVKTLTFKTNKGQVAEFGDAHGPHQEEVFVPEGKRLAGY